MRGSIQLDNPQNACLVMSDLCNSTPRPAERMQEANLEYPPIKVLRYWRPILHEATGLVRSFPVAQKWKNRLHCD
jgi:hypothetical protein